MPILAVFSKIGKVPLNVCSLVKPQAFRHYEINLNLILNSFERTLTVKWVKIVTQMCHTHFTDKIRFAFLPLDAPKLIKNSYFILNFVKKIIEFLYNEC